MYMSQSNLTTDIPTEECKPSWPLDNYMHVLSQINYYYEQTPNKLIPVSPSAKHIQIYVHKK